MKPDNERLKLLLDALVKLAEYWQSASPGQNSHAIYDQIRFIRKKITQELKKED